MSDVLDESTPTHELGEEGVIADAFCRRAEHRAGQWLREPDRNDDDAMSTVAQAVITRGGYAHAI